MAIVKMKKFKLFALEKDRKSLLKELQKFSYVHFVKTKEEDESLKEIELNQDMTTIKEKSQKVKWMLNYFSKLFPKETKKEIDESSIKETLFVLLEQQASKYDFSNDYENLANISREIDSNKEEIANLETYRKELSKWLNIKESLGNLKAFKTAKFFLGTVAKKNFEPLKDKLRNFEHTYIEEISDESSQINIMLLTSNTEEKELKNELKTYSFTETNFNFDTSFTEEYEKTKNREEELKKANEKLKEKVEKLLKLIPKLLIQKEYLDNALMRETVVSNFKATDTVNVIEGYIPLDMEEEFKKIVNKNSNKSNYLEITEVDKDDEEVPILLKNSGITGLFASITQMYALPRYNEIDPTAILSIFYWIFFGMMVADFAYGLILFILSGLALMIGKFDENKKKFLKFFFALSFSTMIWGLLYGSAFGDLIKLPTQVLDSSKDFMSIFILSIIFGAIHLVIALGIKAYILIKNGHFMDVIYDVFLWYLTLTSLIILLLAGRFGLSEFTKNIFIACAVIGMLGIVVFGARDAKTLVGRIGGGLYSLYGITSYIGDFVSYLRLMALGLAGGFIASAINIIVKMLVSKGILGIILGVVVFTLGQSFNIFLSFLSSYVHTSRLTYVEFFSKFYEGGGKAFKKFRV
ncbi:V-type ATP synthase subunit I [Fusobacterium pseudoperiodonticum]|uniref:V-type ATP synthase subunit I n=1 Tax=Fusobacterium pseudoperiodonticum TaxID=2663009 RepID=A0A2G9EE91_9FUSO|nr:V-type ATP synthase subunit I [Fusobacterium pseudoperiodonticum]PIM79250.1 V-type ATP synthase subunit I [Fusobacterium pseudoperiodonticum]